MTFPWPGGSWVISIIDLDGIPACLRDPRRFRRRFTIPREANISIMKSLGGKADSAIEAASNGDATQTYRPAGGSKPPGYSYEV
jgi:hypothetical protein